MRFSFFFFKCYGAHRHLHYPLRRQRQMCIRDRGAVRGGDGVRAVPQAAQQQDGLGQVARVGILLERRVQAALAVIEADRALRLVLDRPALTGRGAPLDRVIQDAPVEVPGLSLIHI